jgi:hypothetical protein
MHIPAGAVVLRNESHCALRHLHAVKESLEVVRETRKTSYSLMNAGQLIAGY